jgi:hypothetical protein
MLSGFFSRRDKIPVPKKKKSKSVHKTLKKMLSNLNTKTQIISTARYFLSSTLAATAGAISSYYLCIANFGNPKQNDATYHIKIPVCTSVFTVIFAMTTAPADAPLAFSLLYFPMSFVISMFGIIVAAIAYTPENQSGYHTYRKETSVKVGDKDESERVLD